MRLWHQYIIEYLPANQLLGQHREICGLRGLGFGKKHKTVNYVFKYPYYNLYKFHLIILNEMEKRGYKIDYKWYNRCYRGKKIGIDDSIFTIKGDVDSLIYKEHDDKYLLECLLNLKNKGIILKIKFNSKIYYILKEYSWLDYVDFKNN